MRATGVVLIEPIVLVECIDEIPNPVRAVLRGRPFSRRAIMRSKRGGHRGPPVQVR